MDCNPNEEACKANLGLRDAKLVEQTLEGDRTAFAKLVEYHQSYVRNLLRSLCRNSHSADDLAQESFVTAWQKLSTLKEGANFGSWIRQIAYRQFLHLQRRTKVELNYLDSIIDGPEGLDQAYRIDQSELGLDQDIIELMAPLSDYERELFILLFAFEFTYAEIAENRGVSTGTLKSHVHRAKQKINIELSKGKIEEK